MTSNVGQSYPYTSETETDRATSVKALVDARPDLGETLASRDDAARRQRALVGLEVPDAGLSRAAPRCGLRGREARALRRV